LLAATEKMMAPTSLAREVLGDDFVEHYGATRVRAVLLSPSMCDRNWRLTPSFDRAQLNEWNVFSQAVTDWELKRYLELA